jgi:ubiquinol-cytochrome c reductase cytochrome c1 subunit
MIRLFAILIGLFFGGMALLGFLNGAWVSATEGMGEETAESVFHKHPKELHLASDGPFGRFDRQQVQRGLQVYSEVCAACHSLEYVAFRDMAQLGYSEAEVKAFAASKQVPGIDPNTGEATTRPGTPTDYFPSPYPNDVAAAAANNNAIPPDLSLIAKARGGGAPYTYSLLTGYQEPSAELLERFPDAAPGPGLYHNPYFANLNLAMAPPLVLDGQVTYEDGTEATIDQMAQDVSAFLEWTAEPTQEKRKQTGWIVVLFLIFATGLAWMAKKQVWANIKPKKKA